MEENCKLNEVNAEMTHFFSNMMYVYIYIHSWKKEDPHNPSEQRPV